MKDALRVLIIEDDPDYATTVDRVLRAGDPPCVLTLVETLAAGVKRAADADLILLDLGLPDGQGLTNIEAIRRVTARPALIVLTGQDESAFGVKAVRLGADDFLQKATFDAERLRRAVRYALERRRFHQRELDLESQVREAQKLEAVGRLASGIAHEFNNLLTGIASLGFLIQKDLGQGHSSFRDVKQILQLSERGADLVKRLLAFSREQAPSKAAFRLNDLVTRDRNLLAATFGQGVNLTVDLDATSPPVDADEAQIEQVLMNLCLNAKDAVQGAGPIRISTGVLALRETRESPQGTLPPGTYGVLSVEDGGPGIAPQDRARLFEPFFTTKAVGQGTGLGLAIAYGIVKNHGGLLDFESPPGGGTIFRIYLPAAGIGAKPAARPKDEQLARGDETILIAEDEEVVRDSLQRILQDCGYKVLKAADGEEATRLLEKHKDAIRLAVLDILLPGVKGLDIYDELRRQGARTKVLFVSAYLSPPVRGQLASRGVPFVPKPFTANDLADKVRRGLDGVA